MAKRSVSQASGWAARTFLCSWVNPGSWELLERLQRLIEAVPGSRSSTVSFQHEIFKLALLLCGTRCWQGRHQIQEAHAGRWCGVGWACVWALSVCRRLSQACLLLHTLGIPQAWRRSRRSCGRLPWQCGVLPGRPLAKPSGAAGQALEVPGAAALRV